MASVTLDDAIRLATANGAKGVTIWRCYEGFQANVQNPEGGWSVGIDTDPVAALFKALRQDPAPPPHGDLFE